MLQPQLPQDNSPTAPSEPMAMDNTTPESPTGVPEEGGIVEGLKAHLDQIPDDQKQFLAEHLTTEFVRAIGIITGPEVAEYLAQFVDPNKVMVPVPRDVAEQHLAQQQGQPAQPQTSGQPSAPPPSAQQAPQAGLMSPQA